MHAKALGDHSRQVDPTPAHHAMLGKPRPLADQLCNLRLLLRRQPRLRTGRDTVRQPRQAKLIVAMHPVAQSLPIHPTELRRLGACAPVQHKRQRQHPTRRIRVSRSRRRMPQPRCIQLPPRDPNPSHHHLSPRIDTRVVNHGKRPNGIRDESRHGAAGIICSRPRQKVNVAAAPPRHPLHVTAPMLASIAVSVSCAAAMAEGGCRARLCGLSFV